MPQKVQNDQKYFLSALIYGTCRHILTSGLPLYPDIVSTLKWSPVPRSYLYSCSEDYPDVIFMLFKDSDYDKGKNALSNWITLKSMKVYLSSQKIKTNFLCVLRLMKKHSLKGCCLIINIIFTENTQKTKKKLSIT